MWRNYFTCTRYVDEVPFLIFWNTKEDTLKTFYDQWRMFKNFVSKCEVSFRITHWQNKTRRFDTEGFAPVSSLCGVVGSPSWFTKCLIGITGNIWSVVHINVRYIYLPETHVCTIIGCAIFRNVIQVNSTWLFVYWLYGVAN